MIYFAYHHHSKDPITTHGSDYAIGKISYLIIRIITNKSDYLQKGLKKS